MQHKMLFDNTKISLLGLGTWGFGGTVEKETNHDIECINVIKYAIKQGINYIDTGEFYANGHTEELIGRAIKEFDRKDIFLSVRAGVENLSYDDLINSAEKSLKKLDTDYIDLYMPQKSNPNIPLKETIKTLNYLVDQHLIKYIGVSNFSVEKFNEAQLYSNYKIVANQVEYSLLIRNNSHLNSNVESEVIPFCQKNNILVIAWRPLAAGRLFNQSFQTLDSLAKKYEKTKAQIALNWLISKNIIAIPKASNISHIKENLGALGWNLEDEDIKRLDNLEKSLNDNGQ